MKLVDHIHNLTIEEKISLLAGASLWSTQGIERLEIPAITLTDGPHGVRLSASSNPGEVLSNTSPATAFPIEAAMAATWNESLIHELGAVIAEECQYYDVGVVLGPGVNGKRSPLGGRNFEYFSEDPFLTGKMGAAFVKGVQSGGIGTSVKHFVANEQETNRMVVSSEVDERTLRELYLLPFEMIVREAKPWTVMCSYNLVNGTSMANNEQLLNGVLKGEWGYDGLVMSDWGAVVDKTASVQHGLDLEMPGPSARNDEVLAAYREGRITDEQLDDHVRRLLQLVQRVLDHKRDVRTIDKDAHHEVARKVAEEAIVLLKNEDAILPLNKQANIAVLGQFAKEPRFQGGGSSHMNPTKLDIPFEEISKFARTVYGAGYDDELMADEALIQEACRLAEEQDAVILFAGTTDRIEGEGHDRKDLNIPPSHIRLIEEVSRVNPNVIVIVNSGSATHIGDYEGKVKAIVQAWLPGQAGGSALANVLFGEVNPSGKLTETFPLALEHNPTYLSFPGDVKKVHYSEGLFVGYRYYDTKKMDVHYPFGYGLSYTRFAYSNLRLSSHSLKSGDVVTVWVDIQNIGERAGKEVVQVYVNDLECTVRKADKELKGFAKVDLAPGEKKTVGIELDERAFSHYFEHLGKFAVESGEFEVLVGSSSRDIHLADRMFFLSSEDTREPLTNLHSLRQWLNDDRHKEKVLFLLNQLHIDEDSPMHPIYLGMPIRTVMNFLSSFGYTEEQLNQINRMFNS